MCITKHDTDNMNQQSYTTPALTVETKLSFLMSCIWALSSIRNYLLKSANILR